jgi:hypothetical protein
MTSTEQIFDLVLGEQPIDPELLAACVDALQACALACTVCADADLHEPDVAELVECVRRNRDCTEVCVAAIGVVARWREQNHALVVALLGACIVACDLCATECERHDHDHCRECAVLCRRAESACRALLEEVGREVREGYDVEPSAD